MKSLLHLVLASVALFLTHAAYAEDKLFPTDILDKGEFDTRLSLGYDTNSEDVSSHGNPGHQTSSLASESVQVRFGLGSNWHVGLALPYISRDVTHTDYTNPVAHFTGQGKEGTQNPQFWAKYGFIDDVESPWSLSGQLLLAPDTTGKSGTTYLAGISAGWKENKTLRYYGVFTSEMPQGDNNPDRYGIELGAYKEISEKVTLIPHLGIAEIQSTPTFSSFTQFDIGMSSNIEVSNNTYLIPSLVLYSNTSGENKNGSFLREASNNGKAISIGLYHLF